MRKKTREHGIMRTRGTECLKKGGMVDCVKWHQEVTLDKNIKVSIKCNFMRINSDLSGVSGGRNKIKWIATKKVKMESVFSQGDKD